MSESKYRDFLRLTSAIFRVLGMVCFVGVIVFWAITQQFEATIFSGCIVVAGVGQGLDVVKEIVDTRAEIRRLPIPEPTPPPEPPAAEPPPAPVGTGGA